MISEKNWHCSTFLKGAKDEVHFEFESSEHDVELNTKEEAKEWAWAEVEDWISYSDFVYGFSEYEKYKDTIGDPKNWDSECWEVASVKEWDCKVHLTGKWETKLGKMGHLLTEIEAKKMAVEKFNRMKDDYPVDDLNVFATCTAKGKKEILWT